MTITRKEGAIGILLGFVLVLCAGLLPGIISTAHAADYELWVGNTRVTSGNASDIFGDGKASYDAATSTLTLNGYDNNGSVNPQSGTVIYSGGDLTISLSNENVLGNENGHGIMCMSGKVTIAGNGKLAINAKWDGIQANKGVSIKSGDVSVSSGENHIGINATGDNAEITVEGGTLTVNSVDRCIVAHTGTLEISGGTVTAKSTNARGIEIDKQIEITGGEVDVNSPKEAIVSRTSSVTMSGGTVKATSTGESSMALNASQLTVSGGKLTATGKGSGISVFSFIVTDGTVIATSADDNGVNCVTGTIGGGTVTASGAQSGILANMTLTIEGGTVTATASGADMSAGIDGRLAAINGGTVTATGTYKAISSEVKNKIAGTGWANVEGTAGKENIAISDESRALSFKKVQFPAAADPIPVESVTLDKKEATMAVGETLQLKATVEPADATRPDLAWESSDKSIATVDGTGKVTAVADGTATITVKSTDGSDKSATCTVTVSTVSTVEMHRLYNPNSGEHFYTASEAERDNVVAAGWNYEGIGWTAPAASNTPVYRLYNEIAGDHHYTTNAEERDWLVGLGWNDEGTGWYSDDAQGVTLMREYNPNQFANNHNFTADVSEHESLVSIGWIDEGIGWYGVALS